MDTRKHTILTKYKECGQEHVFQHWENLSTEQQTLLLDQLETIQVQNVADYLKAAMQEFKSSTSTGDGGIKPFSGIVGKSAESEQSSSNGDKKNDNGNGNGNANDDLQQLGMEAIRKNKVAAVLLAGGQGSRLGFDGPKGMYDIGLQSGMTLFCLIAKRIVKLQALAQHSRIIQAEHEHDTQGNDGDGVRIPLYVMTSPMNHEMTKEYFETNDYFGTRAEDVIFFSQGVLPCLSNEGKIMMENPYKCVMAPDGNGGIYPAMEKWGVLADMEQRGVEHIHTFSVDNALVKPADPGFIGYCIKLKADCGNKVLWKSDPHEKVGIIAEKNGKPCVVEYSELSKEMTEMVGEDSAQLAYGAANICNHYYSLDFLQKKVIPNLGNMFHIARKKIGTWDDEKKDTVTPTTSNNGMKLESFIFDVFPLSSSMAIYQVERMHEFAPVKNAPGSASDSPDTARAMISAVAKIWLEEAGASLTGDLQSEKCEISPLVSYGGENLDSYKDEKIHCPFVLDNVEGTES
jgi:UDP-N-acetylglucosamine/UDP-N-acetylgalactosamine diphosphorylase